MSKPAIRAIDIVSFILTIVTIGVQCGGFFYPVWWSYESKTTQQKLKFGMIFSKECTSNGQCEDKAAVVIEGGKEWLFLTRVFEAFGVLLCLIAVVVQIIFLPTRKYSVRSSAIYTLGAAGLFIWAGAFLFVAKYTDLESGLPTGSEGTLAPGFGLCIAAGIFAFAAAIVTGVATVKKGDDYYD